MKVLLVGEGPSELAGALRAFVIRLGVSDHDIVQDRVSQRTIHAHHGKGKGYFKRAVRWMLEAQKRGYDAIILVVDQDDQPQRSKECDEAQQYASASIRRAFGVAIRTFDAWMLADEQALTTVLGYEVLRQRNPEKLADPKSVCNQLLDASEVAMGSAEMYAAVAGAVNLNILKSRCSKGFAPFAERVRELAQ